MPPALVIERPSPPRRDKSVFANRAARFAKRAPPGASLLWLGTLAAIIVMTAAGAFGTVGLPIGIRAVFWSLLIGWSALKWQAWFLLTVRNPRDWRRAVFAGGLCLNLLLPIEIEAALWLIGRPGPVSAAHVWLSALAISAALAVMIFAAVGRQAVGPSPKQTAGPVADGPVARAGLDPEEIVAMEAEDHYCRLHRADGGSVLVHGRFQDGLAELATTAGARVHRGAWVAARAVAGAVREGRRWRLVLTDGRLFRISPRHLAEARARGWLRRPDLAQALRDD